MNRTFKVVFNKARGALMVANEATSSVQKSSTKACMLYLSILNETKSMVLQARNLLKSQSYFLKNKDE